MEVLEIKDLMTESRVQSILTETGLDFNIDKIPLTGIYNDDEIKSGYVGLVNSKSKKVIHAAKPGYTVSQNEVLVRLMLKGVQEFGNLKVHKGGSLNGGRRTFLQLEIKGDQLSTIRGDEVKRYLTGLDSNNGSSALSFGYGNKHMSCLNQWNQFLKESIYKIYHNSDLERKLELVPDIIFECLQRDFRTMELLHEMAETSIQKELAHKMVKSLIGVDRTMTKDELKELDL